MPDVQVLNTVVKELLFALFMKLSEWRPSVVVIDDAHQSDEDSWALAADISKAKPPAILIFVMRPVAIYRGLYRRISAQYYRTREQVCAYHPPSPICTSPPPFPSNRRPTPFSWMLCHLSWWRSWCSTSWGLRGS